MYKIPFPAVTICPVTKAKSDFVNFTDNYNIMEGEFTSFKNLTDEA